MTEPYIDDEWPGDWHDDEWWHDDEFEPLTAEQIAELGVDMPLGDMCRAATQRRDYRPSTHRIRTLPARGNYL
ncbi:hypothetical protein [Mycolicibacterium mageritense]|uniref:hypothetical protein n=1 Tax=Mycolicibacterium mageritense TaxID=53462 RepID=UPI001E5370D8|nr:hypothetical protein [Mycolicibacterium mageritense]GJJ24102.1 hypothetical protein MTY414_77760 [Mycolicibacterium mageritense]